MTENLSKKAVGMVEIQAADLVVPPTHTSLKICTRRTEVLLILVILSGLRMLNCTHLGLVSRCAYMNTFSQLRRILTLLTSIRNLLRTENRKKGTENIESTTMTIGLTLVCEIMPTS